MKGMKRPAGTDKDGFTLIEVVASVALIALISTGFMTMAAGSAGVITREYQMDRLSYRLSQMAAEGGGEATGAGLAVHFELDGTEPLGDSYTETGAEEIFLEYKASKQGTEVSNQITFYRHR